ncbi:MAG: RluA family pseudouridine synthase [Betaproteobacteria bacterium]|nr:RluA family pseudouridine synthase [Betaproteobacteria bacterium]
MKGLGKNTVSRHRIDPEAAGQRIDNYLVKILKGVPKSHVYRILRSGEVRVNRGRIGPDYRLQPGDELRLPPVRVAERAPRRAPPADARLEQAILFEDEHLLALNKPSGMAVHGGSGVSFGVIEQLRAQRPQARFLELLAKKRSALITLHAALRAGRVKKYYLALVKGAWRGATQSVRLSLHKYVLASGERRVAVNAAGQEAHTVFRCERAWREFSLLRAELKTGRTHQIRVHLAHLGFPIAGDDKYGDFELNKRLARAGLKRMFLHASGIGFEHPATGSMLTLEAPLPAELQSFLNTLQ